MAAFALEADAELAPLQPTMELAPAAEEMGQGRQAPATQLVNPRCLAATCGAFGVFAVAVAATQMRSSPSPAANVNQSTTFDEENDKDNESDASASDDDDDDDDDTDTDDDVEENALAGKSIVLVCTSADHIKMKHGKTHPTGVWLEEAAKPYYLFKKAGADVTIASPLGGEIPIDDASMQGDFFTDAAKRFMKDDKAQDLLKNSIKLHTLGGGQDFDGLYCAGGHGATVDYRKCTKIVEKMYAAGKPIAFDCHGPVALYHAKDENGEYIVKGKTVTGFSDSEEKAVGMDKMVKAPETRLKELGANYTHGEDWAPHVEQDGNLITGQNPASSRRCAKLLIKALAEQ